MRYTFSAALLAATSIVLPARAQDETIVITATRTETEAERLPADVTVIDTDAARARGQITLDAALDDAPGIQAPRSGPIGQQASIFSGGFESNHTLVLFDGTRIDDPSTPEGLFDAGQDTLGDAARIEVVQGPMSALYGSNALGGVVNILPRHGRDGPLNGRLDVAAASFETLTANAGVEGALRGLRYALNGEGYTSAGYDAVPERISTHNGEEDGADLSTVTGLFDLSLTDTIAVDLLLRRRKADVQIDYDPFGNISETDAEVDSETALWRLGASWDPTGALSLRVRGGQLDTDRYNIVGGAVSDEYHGVRHFAVGSATWRFDRWTLITGAEIENESINAVSFGSPIVGEQEHWGAFLATQGAFGALDVTGAVRHDDFDSFGDETTWRIGAAYNFGFVRAHAAYGTGYRAPSLYERFVPFFGAAGLDPESAETWEVGANSALALFGRNDGVELGLLYRSSEIDDLIGFFGFSYANIDRAEIAFAEARLAVRPVEWLTARVVYANTDAVDATTESLLLRRARHAWSAELETEYGAFGAVLSWRQVGSRYDTVYDDLGLWAGTGRVEAYDIVRASASWQFNDEVKLYIAADNVLDETYEPVNGFAGAPASLLVGIRVSP